MDEINIGDLVLNVNFLTGERNLGWVVKKQNDHAEGCYEWWNIQWFNVEPEHTIVGYNTTSIRDMKENVRLVYGSR